MWQLSNETNLDISIYYDELTTTLQQDVLFIKNKNLKNFAQKIEQLKGIIIYKNKFSFLIRFDDFKIATIAHEELRKEMSVKFAYKSEAKKYLQNARVNEEKYQLKNDIKLLIEKYQINSQNCEDKTIEIQEKQNQINRQNELDEQEEREKNPRNILETLQKLYHQL